MAGKKTNQSTDEAIKATNLTKEDRRFIAEHGEQLADSTKRAKWIHGDEAADRDGQTLATRDHGVIQRWAEARGAVPATVPGTEHDDHAGVLRFIFDPKGDERLAAISWEEWFRPFDERDLVFLFQERKADGAQSNFFRLDNPTREDA